MNSQRKHDLRTAYDRKAADRAGKPVESWKDQERGEFLKHLSRLQEHRQSDVPLRLLEIGAGPGIDSAFFQAQGLSVTCTDLSPEMVRLCLDRGLNARVMDFCDLQFPSDSFDAVYARNALLHLAKSEFPSTLVGINEVLSPGGLFYLGLYGGSDHEGVWQDDPYEPQRFFSFFEDERLKRVLSEIFEIISFKRVLVNDPHSDLHFQSVILRKNV